MWKPVEASMEVASKLVQPPGCFRCAPTIIVCSTELFAECHRGPWRTAEVYGTPSYMPRTSTELQGGTYDFRPFPSMRWSSMETRGPPRKQMEFRPNTTSHGVPAPWKFLAIYMAFVRLAPCSIEGYAMAFRGVPRIFSDLNPKLNPIRYSLQARGCCMVQASDVFLIFSV